MLSQGLDFVYFQVRHLEALKSCQSPKTLVSHPQIECEIPARTPVAVLSNLLEDVCNPEPRPLSSFKAVLASSSGAWAEPSALPRRQLGWLSVEYPLKTRVFAVSLFFCAGSVFGAKLGIGSLPILLHRKCQRHLNRSHGLQKQKLVELYVAFPTEPGLAHLPPRLCYELCFGKDWEGQGTS